MDESIQSDYTILVNQEEQYSLWQIGVAVPAGWREIGQRGDKETLKKYLDEHWTDMRPLSLRQRMPHHEADTPN
jgi:MbtH protein